MKFADVVKKKMLKEHIDYDDPNLQKAYSHDRMGYVIASEYIEALESMGYSKEEIYVIYGSTYTRHQLDKLFDNILPAIKKFWISQTKLSKSNYDKMLKENMKKQFNLISIVKKILKESSSTRSFDDNLEILRKFDAEDKSYSREAREILQDADEMTDDELSETVDDFMKSWRLTDPRISSSTTIKRRPNPWDSDYRDGDYS